MTLHITSKLVKILRYAIFVMSLFQLYIKIINVSRLDVILPIYKKGQTWQFKYGHENGFNLP